MRFLPLVWALVAAAGSAAALAQTPAPAANHGPERTPPAGVAALSQGEIKAMRDFKLLDFNRDGKISRTEVALFPRLSAAFNDADTDGDGYLSYEEVRAYAVRYRAERDRAKAAQAAGQQP